MHGRSYPIYSGKDVVTAIESGIYKVKMQGITHIIVKEEESESYLTVKENIKENAVKLIEKVGDFDTEAIGVMFLEKVEQKLKINPVVWVKSIDTLFYETACGSGSAAVGILASLEEGIDQTLEILQPSGQIISASVNIKAGRTMNVIISGKVITDGVFKQIKAT